VSFTNFTIGHGDSVDEEFVELVFNESIRHGDSFDDRPSPVTGRRRFS
jgi:hypothetical protein